MEVTILLFLYGGNYSTYSSCMDVSVAVFKRLFVLTVDGAADISSLIDV